MMRNQCRRLWSLGYLDKSLSIFLKNRFAGHRPKIAIEELLSLFSTMVETKTASALSEFVRLVFQKSSLNQMEAMVDDSKTVNYHEMTNLEQNKT